MLDDEKIQEIYKKIGQNVAAARKERKISQLALSLEMGYKSVSLVSFGEICLKGAHFNIAHLLQISQILDIPFNSLFNGIQEILDKSKDLEP
ncbi:helix-turn-helix domain-containing protein [Campylobacter upsaliensis]|uniref:XRE family transcriptional regulator n=1 Tax=Campylobacter upsaliensis TaxID=28080 RepID=A0A3S4SJP6_CAMUP|nr:hypothetical protein [Campylobacter upsaliensis]ELS3707721.1 hypothetical protein [Campylobacter upsaliensis]MCA5589020.1 hypothetical protein [Campylobacter upsaliensis]MEB2790853.1 hypothetical protein [Campylobacter upsaliensis]MEB2806547.1 hypothetical protein [Campylobacter upsaliensis]MEB2818215.1 hypothetical protein [Campylobacter upsaliensis]